MKTIRYQLKISNSIMFLQTSIYNKRLREQMTKGRLKTKLSLNFARKQNRSP